LKEPSLNVEIEREAPVTLLPFTDFFRGFEKLEAVRSIFGAKTDQVLKGLKVEFYSSKFGYMSVSDIDGHLLVSSHHLKSSDERVIYLDVIHELFHVKQFMEGMNLFPPEFDYVDSPIEIPAYKHTVKEARRIGMKQKEIEEYLKVEWVDEEQHSRLLRAVL